MQHTTRMKVTERRTPYCSAKGPMNMRTRMVPATPATLPYVMSFGCRPMGVVKLAALRVRGPLGPLYHWLTQLGPTPPHPAG